MGSFDRRAQTHARYPGVAFPPRRGVWTQCVCVLFDTQPRLSLLREQLGGHSVVGESPATPGVAGWATAGPSFDVAYRPDVNGYARIDVVDRPWPDEMGASEGSIFAAWARGAFGPSSYPGSLQRALQHARRWPAARELAARHGAFARIRTTYALGARKGVPLLPAGYDPVAELLFVTEIACALLETPSALCVFNPNGETLLDALALEALLDRHRMGGPLPVEAWANVRLFRPGVFAGQPWLLFDTVGLEQVGVRDHEGTFPESSRSFEHVPGLLYTMASYDMANGGVLGVGDTADDLAGAGWRAQMTATRS